ncbi:MAG TPA: cation:proton antiporter, partial [Clostridia bacterium]|nr:cation:proton antiporter [Clostridia bacterium]
SEFNLSYFKKVGATPVIIAISEAFGAIILVTGTLLVLGFDPKLSIMLGAIAAATAPAQTIMVINQYQSRGHLTSMLMSVVAIDDAVALIGFGFAATIVGILGTGGSEGLLISILTPFYEIAVSFVIGALLSLIMKLFFRWFKKPSNRICIITGAILLAYWFAQITHASSLLTCMALGGVLVNITDDIKSVTKTVDAFTPPIFLLFFVISGAGFEVSALKSIGLIGIIYVVVRVAGKIFGAWFGGTVTKQDRSIRKYLGPALMPQAGVALGLIVVASSIVPEYSSQIRVIILSSTFIYSIAGPIAAKFALVKAGDIILEPKKHKQTRSALKSQA